MGRGREEAEGRDLKRYFESSHLHDVDLDLESVLARVSKQQAAAAATAADIPKKQKYLKAPNKFGGQA
ncbi:hypothetical protein M0804_008940 [Polistes exclamans]|nr:hypothetical protein M0804_008940 [Polistes exclamans]